MFQMHLFKYTCNLSSWVTKCLECVELKAYVESDVSEQKWNTRSKGFLFNDFGKTFHYIKLFTDEILSVFEAFNPCEPNPCGDATCVVEEGVPLCFGKLSFILLFPVSSALVVLLITGCRCLLSACFVLLCMLFITLNCMWPCQRFMDQSQCISPSTPFVLSHPSVLCTKPASSCVVFMFSLHFGSQI